jgi:3-methyladenine DNA glycosylase Tag
LPALDYDAAMITFAEIRARAEARKGGAEHLAALLPAATNRKQLETLADDRALAEMAKCIFRSGFSWKVVEAKWPGFEEAFEGFDPGRLMFEPDEFWDARVSDTRIIRHGTKIGSVRHNAGFVIDIAREHGSFGRFAAAWPEDDIVGLWDLLAKRGKRLGGNTGRYFLRFIGKDCFLPSRDVIMTLRDAGLEVAEIPTSKRDLKAIQAQFNTWHDESGLTYSQLSRICAMSIGENYEAETLQGRMRTGQDD